MALTSASTLQDATDQFMDNLSWDRDATKAAAALEAVRAILLLRPTTVGFDGKGTMSRESLLNLEEKLAKHVKNNAAATNRAYFTRGRAMVV